MTESTRPVPGFQATSFTHRGKARRVFLAGTGPAVVVVHEVPGLHPGVIAFGQRLVDAGFTVYLPSLFGRPGEPVTTGAGIRALGRVCVAREFTLLADRTSPVTHWLRALAVQAQADCGGPGVGAVGMCITGGFALAMAVEPAVLAPVLSQPSVPAGWTVGKRAALGLDREDLTRVRERSRDGLCVLGLRFSQDKLSPADRFATLRRTLGDAFEGVEIDSSPRNPHGIRTGAHSVLASDFVDEPGHPTRAALDRVLTFLHEKLHT